MFNNNDVDLFYVEKQEKKCIEQWVISDFNALCPINPTKPMSRADSTAKSNSKMAIEFKDKSDAVGAYCFFKTLSDRNESIYISKSKSDYLFNNYEKAFICFFFRDKVALINVKDIVNQEISHDYVWNPEKGCKCWEWNYHVPTNVCITENNRYFYEK